MIFNDVAIKNVLVRNNDPNLRINVTLRYILVNRMILSLKYKKKSNVLNIFLIGIFFGLSLILLTFYCGKLNNIFYVLHSVK